MTDARRHVFGSFKAEAGEASLGEVRSSASQEWRLTRFGFPSSNHPIPKSSPRPSPHPQSKPIPIQDKSKSRRVIGAHLLLSPHVTSLKKVGNSPKSAPRISLAHFWPLLPHRSPSFASFGPARVPRRKKNPAEDNSSMA